MFIDARSSWNQLTAAHLALVLVVAMSAAVQAAPVNGSHAFETAAECNRAETGHVEFGLDVYGSFGSAVSDGSDALFDPANDDPDRGARGTVYESMPFLCRSQERRYGGTWLERGPLAVNTVTDGVDNRMTSQYTVDGVEVDLTATLDCNILTQCWTFTNRTNAELDTLAIIHYIDGDLFFEGSFGNDYAGASVGVPKQVYEFDAGDDPNEPTTLLKLYGEEPDDRFLTGWEVAEYAESRGRISNVRDGCEPLRNGITDDRGDNQDLDGDRVTDNGYDVTIAMRLTSVHCRRGDEPCSVLQHSVGYARACVDEDMDICV